MKVDQDREEAAENVQHLRLVIPSFLQLAAEVPALDQLLHEEDARVFAASSHEVLDVARDPGVAELLEHPRLPLVQRPRLVVRRTPKRHLLDRDVRAVRHPEGSEGHTGAAPPKHLHQLEASDQQDGTAAGDTGVGVARFATGSADQRHARVPGGSRGASGWKIPTHAGATVGVLRVTKSRKATPSAPRHPAPTHEQAEVLRSEVPVGDVDQRESEGRNDEEHGTHVSGGGPSSWPPAAGLPRSARPGSTGRAAPCPRGSSPGTSRYVRTGSSTAWRTPARSSSRVSFPV